MLDAPATKHLSTAEVDLGVVEAKAKSLGLQVSLYLSFFLVFFLLWCGFSVYVALVALGLAP